MTLGFGQSSAFAIDSLATLKDSAGMTTGHATTCKVRAVRPDVLIASVGLSEAALGGRPWIALDEAESAIEQFPVLLTPQMLEAFSERWMNGLAHRLREAGQIPTKEGEVADILVLTYFENAPLFVKDRVFWDGTKFGANVFVVDEESLERKSIPSIYYSGACRSFVAARGEDGKLHPPSVRMSASDRVILRDLELRQDQAHSSEDLEQVALLYESQFVHLDQEFEGDRAVIGPPFASARWDALRKRWQTNFNEECRTQKSPSH